MCHSVLTAVIQVMDLKVCFSVVGLLARDQLLMVCQQERAFHELSETLPTFNPTYKFIVGTPNYDPKYVLKLTEVQSNLSLKQKTLTNFLLVFRFSDHFRSATNVIF